MNEVTVSITTTGRPAFLRTALEAVRNQIGVEVIGEVIVSENSGERATERVVQEFSDLPIRYLFREPILPMVDHLFSTFREAHTPYVAILNDDDWWSAGHIADGLRTLKASNAVAYASASEFVVGEGYKDPCWVDRSSAIWLVAGKPSWVGAWTLDCPEMLALCWLYTPFHWSSLIALTERLVPVLDELERQTYETHTMDRLVFALMSLHGVLRYNPIPDTFVRWHDGNWVKNQAPTKIQEVLRSTMALVKGIADRAGCNLTDIWRRALASMPEDVELDVLWRFREAFSNVELKQLGFAEFFHKQPPNSRLIALRNIAANSRKFVLGRS